MAGYQIQHLNPRHFKIVDYAVRGWTVNQIAEKLNMRATSVSLIFNSPAFKHEYAIRRAVHEEHVDGDVLESDDDITKILKEGAKAAAEKLVGHIDSFDDSISVKSCAEVLDRSGYTKKVPETNRDVGTSIVLTGDDAKLIVESINLDVNVAEPVLAVASKEVDGD